MASAAELAILLTAKDLTKQGFDSATSGISGFGKAAVAALAGLTVALGGIGAASIGAAAGFEQTMSGVKAVSGGTADEIKGLSKLALQLGKDTSFSASEAAASIEELVKGGLSISDIMDGAAKATLNLAAAGGVDLVTAATISANALAQFNLKGSDMAKVADLIAGAANASALDVNQFGLSLSMSGAVASTVGFKFDDLAQAIAVMGKAGITGSDAGTSLKTMMLNLAPQTDKAAGLMKELGIITATGANQFFDATGKVKSMAEVAGILQTATANLTNEQKLSTLATLFGTDAIRAAAIFSKEGAAGFAEMAASMGKVTAESVGNERLNNWKGSIDQLKGSLETAGITLGTVFLPMLKNATDAATGFVNAAMPWIETAGPQVVTWLEGAAAAAMKVVTAFQSGGLMGAFQEILPHIKAAGTAIWDWAIGAIPGLVAALKDISVQLLAWAISVAPIILGKVGEWRDALVNWIGPMIPGFLVALGGLSSQFVAWIVAQAIVYATQLKTWGQAAIDWIAPMVPGFLVKAGEFGTAVLNWIGDQVAPVKAKLLAWGTTITDWIAPRIGPLLTEAGKFGSAILKWIGDQVQPVKDKLADWGKAAVDWVSPRIQPLLTEAGKLKDQFITWIGNQVEPVKTQLLAWGKAVVDWIAPRVQPFLDELGKLKDSFITWIGDQVEPVKTQLLTWGTLFVDWVGPRVQPFLDELGKLKDRFIEWIGSQVEPVKTKLGEWASAVVDWVVPATQKFLDEWPGMLKRFLEWIEKAAPTLKTKLEEWVPPFLAALALILGALMKWSWDTSLVLHERLVTVWIPAFLGWIWELVQKIPEKLTPLWNAIKSWIAGAAVNAMNAAVEIGQKLVDGIINGLVSLPGRIADAIRNAVTGVPVPTVTVPVNVQQPIVTQPPVNNWAQPAITAPGIVTGANGRYDQVTGTWVSRDSGGGLFAGQAAMVGTGAQPELFVPSTAGTMYPKGTYNLGGGGSTNQEIHVHFNGPVTRDGEQFVVNAIKSAISRGAIKSNVMVGQA